MGRLFSETPHFDALVDLSNESSGKERESLKTQQVSEKPLLLPGVRVADMSRDLEQ